MPETSEDRRLTITALLPAHNEAKTIDDVLSALKSQTCPIDEILVVADACTDNTAELARQHTGVMVVETNERDKGLAQNVVLGDIHTDLIVGYDADTIPNADCTEIMVRDITDNGMDATCATVLPIQKSGLFIRSRRFAYALGRRWWRLCQAKVGRIQVLTGAAYVFRTDAVKAVGGFPSGLVSSDMPLTWEFHKRGYKCGYSGDAVALTVDPETFTVYRNQMRRWASGYFQTMGKYKRVWLTNPRAFLVVGGALFDLVAMFAAELMIVAAVVTGNYGPIEWLLVWMPVRIAINVTLVATVIGLKEALLCVGPYTLVNVYNKWLYFAAGLREWGLGKKYLGWTGRQGRATVISPMTRTRKVALSTIAACGAIAAGLLRLAI